MVLFRDLPMPKKKAPDTPTTELAPAIPIRVETVLSRYPIHRLSPQSEAAISLREVSADGEVLVRWEVSPSLNFGQPGHLAYKVDTIVINRKIEEAAHPAPKMIRLGGMREICRALGLVENGSNTNQIKLALYQNAGAFITAKIRYRQADGTERSIEIGDTRYGVVFTGEQLPGGYKADGVYILLHDFYREILDSAIARPLDYDYLRDLTPAAQRLYELLSYQMFAALKYGRERAKLVYSEFCAHAPLTRYLEFDSVKVQMFKIHAPHRRSKYINKISYEPTKDREGKPDWIMYYEPGPKARAEYRAFTRRQLRAATEFDESFSNQHALPAKEELSPWAVELRHRGITESIAIELARTYPAERIETQLEILDWLQEKQPGKIIDPAAWLVIAVKNGHAPPLGFVSQAEIKRQQAEKRAKEEAEAKERRRKQREAAEEAAYQKAADDYIDRLAPVEFAALEAEALAAADPEARASINNPAMARYRATLVRAVLRDYLRPRLQKARKRPPGRR